MSERCHCTHNVSKRACQHKGFCERIKEVFVIGMLEAELATVRKDRHRSAVAMQKRIDALEAENERVHLDAAAQELANTQQQATIEKLEAELKTIREIIGACTSAEEMIKRLDKKYPALKENDDG